MRVDADGKPVPADCHFLYVHLEVGVAYKGIWLVDDLVALTATCHTEWEVEQPENNSYGPVYHCDAIPADEFSDDKLEPNTLDLFESVKRLLYEKEVHKYHLYVGRILQVEEHSVSFEPGRFWK